MRAATIFFNMERVGDDILRLIGAYNGPTKRKVWTVSSASKVYSVHYSEKGARETLDWVRETSRGNAGSYRVTEVYLYPGDEGQQLKTKGRKRSRF